MQCPLCGNQTVSVSRRELRWTGTRWVVRWENAESCRNCGWDQFDGDLEVEQEVEESE